MDDTIPYSYGMVYDNVIKKLEKKLVFLFQWFIQTVFKATADRCHFFLDPFANATFSINENAIESSHSEKLLGITIDSNLIFKQHDK